MSAMNGSVRWFPAQKAGKMWPKSEADLAGAYVHACRMGTDQALCKTFPGRRNSHWALRPYQKVTCPKCRQHLAEDMLAKQAMAVKKPPHKRRRRKKAREA